jgi:hypothetical protein
MLFPQGSKDRYFAFGDAVQKDLSPVSIIINAIIRRSPLYPI